MVQRRRALVVQRTGWGQVGGLDFIAAANCCGPPAGARRSSISPLLALMRNQVAAATRAGVHAATINSANVADWDDIHRPASVTANSDVLLVEPGTS